MQADRVQLQQVVLNLVMSGIDAMKAVTDRPRELLIKSQPHESGEVLLAVQDSGIGVDQQNMGRLFGKRAGSGPAQAAARAVLSGCQFQGSSSAMRRAGWSAMRASTSAR